MNIGIIGLGVVGNACKFGFELIGHTISIHDIKLKTNIKDVLNTEVNFICVPTPSNDDGSCDLTIVEGVIAELNDAGYTGIVALKSTVPPGTTRQLSEKYKLNICFIPEFLRERCAISDFTEKHDVCIIGTEDEATYEKIKSCHGTLPERFIKLTTEEAEFAKYYNNIYNATLITFANSFYEACSIKNVNYTNVKNAIINRKHINPNYLECNDNFRGFGGMCLPKDTLAMAHMVRNTNIKFFDNLIEENKKYKTTVHNGMRK